VNRGLLLTIMQTAAKIANDVAIWRIAIVALAVTGAAPLLHAQDATYPPHKPSPPKIERQIVVLAESVVQTQWTHFSTALL